MTSKTRMFRVRNFERFQHYKDRSPPWIKLYNELLDDYAFGRLPDASKMHLVAIWLLASRSDNSLPFDPEWIAKRINATEPVNLDLLLAFDFIIIDQELHMSEQSASAPIAERLTRDRGETETETETEGEAEKESRSLALANVSRATIIDEFREWYDAYPSHRGRGHALKAYKAARKKTDHGTLLAGAIRYRDDPNRSPQFTKYPSTWLNAECWNDEPQAERSRSRTMQALDELERRAAS